MEMINGRREFQEEKENPRQKLFGERAQRIDSRIEMNELTQEIIAKIKEKYPDVRISPIITLDDKTSFGDLDIVYETDVDAADDNPLFQEVFAEKMVSYRRQKNEVMDHCLIEVSSGKVVQVDFIRATDREDFETKMVYYSKGHISAAIGTMAANFGFKYGKDGFTYHYIDSATTHHDYTVTKDLRLAMRMLGMNPDDWDAISNTEEAINFLKSSKYYSPEVFTKRSTHRQKEIENNPSQKNFYLSLGSTMDLNRPNQTVDEVRTKCLTDFRQMYPEIAQRIDLQVTQEEQKIAEGRSQRQARLNQKPLK